MSIPRLLVVGGNGYLGSAVCKAAIGKGWQVTSMSSTGKPYTTPAGHTPKWVHAVTWHRASAFEPTMYASLMSSSTAVVHTLGILLEDASYKRSVREGELLSLAKSLALAAFGSGQATNPLKSPEEKRASYEAINRDAALAVLDTMLSATAPSCPSRPFVYVSAADAFRPLVPTRYIETKREAEKEILRRCTAESGIRPIIIRPGLMYHPHVRPLTTLPAFALSLSSSLHDTVPFPSPFSSQSVFSGVHKSLTTHPIHVDHVADAILKCITEERTDVVDVDTMRRWAGFPVTTHSNPKQPNGVMLHD